MKLDELKHQLESSHIHTLKHLANYGAATTLEGEAHDAIERLEAALAEALRIKEVRLAYAFKKERDAARKAIDWLVEDQLIDESHIALDAPWAYRQIELARQAEKGGA